MFNSGSAKKFGQILLFLRQIRKLCRQKSFSTKRDVFYANVVDFPGGQKEVDSALNVISALLGGIPRIHLRILATSKGIFASSVDLTLIAADEGN